MDFTEMIEDIDRRMDSMLSAPRALHSRRVALMSSMLCERHALDPRRGELSGLAHDLCKEMPRSEQNLLAGSFPGNRLEKGGVSSFITEHIPHGPAAAVWLMEEYELSDTEILEAIACHTVGNPNMSCLASILYCADKLEPGRREVSEDYRELCLSMSIPDMVASVCSHSMEWLRRTGRPIAPQTIVLYNSLLKR
jgi:predicted HD superfamily hydrolase involved in NAD metabolism